MLLQRLREYADRLELPPRLYVEAPVRYIIELDASGNLLARQPTDTAEETARRSGRGARRPVPQVNRSSGIRPFLLADNAEYTLGLARPNTRNRARVAACHAAYLELIRRCAEATGEPAVRAVEAFLRRQPASELYLPDDFDPESKITFRVDWALPVDLPTVRAFWAAEHDPAGRSAPVMECLVCGERRPALERLPAKLKRVPGGQTSGTALISANAGAFESYGLKASLIAPTCAECGERFTKAANHLLSDKSNRIDIGGSAFIFWTREPSVGVPWRALLVDPQPEDVRQLLDSLRTGRKVEVDETAFYATALSGSGGRAVVRDWIDTTVGEAKRHLASWFARQEIIDPYGREPRPLGLYSLALATVREAGDLSPTTARALLRSALLSAPLPWGLLYQAVRRNRADQAVTRPRACLIKLVLLSHDSATKENEMVQLDEGKADPAYRCGRLLAVLEQVQRSALPGVKATIVDRFFGTASSAPASVFGRLLRGAQPHLAKLERDRPSAYGALQRRLEEVQSGLAEFPRTLSLEQQGLFALGYYHQRAFDRSQAREASERRKAGALADAE